MNEGKLKEFYVDTSMKDSVQEFIHLYFEGEAIRRVFSGKDVSDLKEAKDLVDAAFRQLQDTFQPTKERVVSPNKGV